MNATEIIKKYGFIQGEPPNDGIERLAFVIAWPLHPNSPNARRFGRHIARGSISNRQFWKDDGWIGWNFKTLFYHPGVARPSSLEDAPNFRNPDRWEKELTRLLSQ